MALNLDDVHGDDGSSAGQVQDHSNLLPRQPQFARDPVRMPSPAEQVLDDEDYVRTIGPADLARAAVTAVTGVTVTGSRTNY
jgi:hypothetical protein